MYAIVGEPLCPRHLGTNEGVLVREVASFQGMKFYEYIVIEGTIIYRDVLISEGWNLE